ncbi:hypothetical protein DdX_21591 [Ditylenchus destructor]|uniref:Uncharacterized protein n=1 Tax=Ditylenchus destructor TaxID=166010 RepID=A0AAD4MFK6_9BILA|nr:hypothetical protein DdX_21591 [Ditylenchus destructor]
MQAYNFHGGQYFFFLILLCAVTTSLAYISPFYFRTKPYMSTEAISDLDQRSPDIIERKLPNMERLFLCTSNTSLAYNSPRYSRTKLLTTMDMITTPSSLGKYIGHMITAVRGISHRNGFQNLLTRSIQQSLERQAETTEHRETQQNTDMEPATVKPSRRLYDHTCVFDPVNCVNLPRKLSGILKHRR